jgi:hypothetical protein
MGKTMPTPPIPFSSEIVLPRLAKALSHFRRSTRSTNQKIAEELNGVADMLLGHHHGFAMDESRVSRLVKGNPRLRVSPSEWAVFFHVLPDFREQMREVTLQWLGQSAPDSEGDLEQDPVLKSQLEQKYPGVQFIVPNADYEWSVIQLAAQYLAGRITEISANQDRPDSIILLSGGPTQSRLGDAMTRFTAPSVHDFSTDLHFYALNNHHHADNPEISADAVAVRWAKQFGGLPHWSLRQIHREFEEPDLVVLGAGGPNKGHIATLAECANFGELIGDVGYLPIDSNGKEVAVPDVVQHISVDSLRRWSSLVDRPITLVIPHKDNQNDRSSIADFLFSQKLVHVACISTSMAQELSRICV